MDVCDVEDCSVSGANVLSLYSSKISPQNQAVLAKCLSAKRQNDFYLPVLQQ